jgi:hypothetical protein
VAQFARNECGAVSSPFDCTLEQVLRYEHLHANPLSTEDPLRLFTVNKWCPRILSALIDVTKCLGGHKHSGIFRLASDKDAIIMLKSEIEKSGERASERRERAREASVQERRACERGERAREASVQERRACKRGDRASEASPCERSERCPETPASEQRRC